MPQTMKDCPSNNHRSPVSLQDSIEIDVPRTPSQENFDAPNTGDVDENDETPVDILDDYREEYTFIHDKFREIHLPHHDDNHCAACQKLRELDNCLIKYRECMNERFALAIAAEKEKNSPDLNSKIEISYADLERETFFMCMARTHVDYLSHMCPAAWNFIAQRLHQRDSNVAY